MEQILWQDILQHQEQQEQAHLELLAHQLDVLKIKSYPKSLISTFLWESM
jgi:hypothetical protein